jgi:PAS domain S-box-containing protein
MGAWSRDMTTNVVWWSQELEEIFGLEPGGFDQTQMGFHSLVHEDDLPALEEAVEGAVRSQTDYAIEFRFRHASGEWRWMEGRGRAAYDSSGRPIMLYGIGMDITRRRQAERDHAYMAAVVSSSSDAIISKTLQGIITSWNEGAEHIFGYTAAEAVGQPITIIIPPERQDEERGILERLRRGECVEHFETVRLTREGNRIDISVTISPVRDEKGRIIGASKVARDISERKRSDIEREQLLERERAARTRAEEASHLKNEFLATVSHELRTPLNAIMGWARMLSEGSLDEAKARHAAEVIERTARTQAQLIEDLLDVSSIITG